MTKQHRRLEARHHRGAGIDAARDHHTVDRSVDLGVAEVGPRLTELRGLRGERRQLAVGVGGGGVGLRGQRVVVPLGGVEIAPRREVGVEEALRAIERHAGGGHLRLHAGHGGLGLRELGALRKKVGLLRVHLRAVDERIDLGQHVALLDDGVEVDEHLRDPAVDLRADVDLSIGCTVPVACTFSTTSPTAAVAVTYLAGGGGACAARQARAPAMTRRNEPPTARRRNQRRLPSSAPSAFFRSSVTAVDWVMVGGSASFLAEGARRGHEAGSAPARATDGA